MIVHLISALRPFAKLSAYVPIGASDDWPLIVHVRHAGIPPCVTVGQVRKAAKLLHRLEKIAP